MEKSIPRHNKEYLCPICKRKSIFKAKGKSGYFSDQAEAIKIEKASEGIILRHFEVRKSYVTHGTGEYTLSYQEDYRAVFLRSSAFITQFIAVLFIVCMEREIYRSLFPL